MGLEWDCCATCFCESIVRSAVGACELAFYWKGNSYSYTHLGRMRQNRGHGGKSECSDSHLCYYHTHVIPEEVKHSLSVRRSFFGLSQATGAENWYIVNLAMVIYISMDLMSPTSTNIFISNFVKFSKIGQVLDQILLFITFLTFIYIVDLLAFLNNEAGVTGFMLGKSQAISHRVTPMNLSFDIRQCSNHVEKASERRIY